MDKTTNEIFSQDEWCRNNYKWLKQSNEVREEFRRVEQEVKHAIREREILTESTQQEVTDHLTTRAKEVYAWKNQIKACIDEITIETQKLLFQRNRLQCSLENINLSLMVNAECLTIRRQRIGIEICEDSVQTNLLKEEDLLIHIKGILHETIREVSQQIRKNMNIKDALEQDWSDKLEAFRIDTFCSHLHNLATGSISFYSGREELPDRWRTIEDWFEYTKESLNRCRNEKAVSSALRTVIDNLLRDITHDIKEQQDVVDIALARRTAELADAIYRLKQHLKLLSEDISAAEKTINNLKTAILEKEPPLKKAQTRLHYRYERPNMELVKDPAQHSLIRELREIAETIELLKEQLSEAEKSLHKLLETRKGLEIDLAVKEATFCIDKERVTAIRQRFPSQYKLLGYC